MKFIRRFLVSILAPAYNRGLYGIAYGPWGRTAHQFFIRVFSRIYKIDWPQISEFKTLGEFFLRHVEPQQSAAEVVSPAEAKVLEGPLPLFKSSGVSVKGIDYFWDQFVEMPLDGLSRDSVYWNFYLAPKDYHWVHSPAEGTELEGFRFEGATWPVNGLGRWLAPKLYTENERLSFRFQTEKFGRVYLLCVGALGVSALISEKGSVEYGKWTPLAARVARLEKLLAFRLGSSVLMIVERPPSSLFSKNHVVKVGDALC